MTDIILSGCNGHMGKAVSDVVSGQTDVRIAAGIDINTDAKNGYPVFSSIKDCDVKADVIIDFSSPAVLDDILDFGKTKKIPMVLCTTGYSAEQLESIAQASKDAAILRSANMSLRRNSRI